MSFEHRKFLAAPRRAAHRRQDRNGAIKGFLLQGGAPAWAQTVLTAITVGIAWAAYASWSSQESAKQKADIALETMRVVYAAKDCMTFTTFAAFVSARTKEALSALAAKGRSATEACRNDRAKVSAQLPVVRVILDSDATAKLDAVINLMNRPRKSFESLEYADIRSGLAPDEDREMRITRLFEELEVYDTSPPPSRRVLTDDDERQQEYERARKNTIRVRLDEAIKDMEVKFARYVAYQE